MKRVKKLLPIILCFAVIITTFTAVPAVATKAKIGTTYYISSSDGNDKNNGLSAQKAWKSFEKVKDLRLTAGDKVLLKRGDTWNERLEINAPNGTAENWVYVGPYGDTKKEAPIIDRLADDNMDDICVLVQDCVPEAKRQCNYVWIDNLTLKNAVLGVYFRYESSYNNKGVRITDCYFENMRSKKWNEWIAANGIVATHDANLEILSQPKGDLPYLSSIGSVLGKYNKTGGGVNEYYGASAVWVGGVSRTENYLVSDIEMQRLIFTNCESGIGSTGYWPKDPWKFTANWSIKDIYTASGALFFIDGVDCGWDGTEDSKWGIFENLFCEGSIIDPVAMNGTTIAGLITAKNCLIRSAVMNESKNNDYPDGCGYDFERNNINVHIRNSVFANHDGQGVLMMQQKYAKEDGTIFTSPNSNCSITNSLFYNNLQNPYDETFCYDILVWNDNNQDIKIANNYFVFKPKLKKGNVLINAVDSLGDEEEYKIAFSGPMTNGITYSNNKYFRDNTLPSYNECLTKMGLDYLSRYRVTLIETNEETYLGNIIKTATVVQVQETNNAAVIYWFKFSVIISAVILVAAIGIFTVALIQRKGRASK